MPKLFIDMDGTLARFHDEDLYLERMYEKNFFLNLKPFSSMVDAIKQIIRTGTAKVYILSAVINETSKFEKNQWLDEYLPEIDREHRIFTNMDVPKSQWLFIGRRHNVLEKNDILLDDYNKNLEEWKSVGGTAIKAKNNLNHKGLNGPLWNGKLIDITDTSDSIVAKLTDIITHYDEVASRGVKIMKECEDQQGEELEL